MIERFDWTDHAGWRAWVRKFDRFQVEMTIMLGHDGRSRNDGRADWLVRGERLDGRAFAVVYDHPVGEDSGRVRIVVYDHPVGEDSGRVRIVSVWELDDRGLS